MSKRQSCTFFLILVSLYFSPLLNICVTGQNSKTAEIEAHVCDKGMLLQLQAMLCTDIIQRVGKEMIVGVYTKRYQ
jgi:hypothetical protein